MSDPGIPSGDVNTGTSLRNSDLPFNAATKRVSPFRPRRFRGRRGRSASAESSAIDSNLGDTDPRQDPDPGPTKGRLAERLASLRPQFGVARFCSSQLGSASSSDGR